MKSSKQFDYQFKVVVIGGTNSSMQTLGLERPILCPCSFSNHLMLIPNPLLGLSLQPNLQILISTKSKCKSGTQPDNKDLEQLLMHTTEAQQEPWLCLTLHEGLLSRTSQNGSNSCNSKRPKILSQFQQVNYVNNSGNKSDLP